MFPGAGLGRAEAPGLADKDGFDGSPTLVEGVIGWLGSEDARAISRAELEDRLSADVREVICQLFQDHVDLRAERVKQRLGAVTSSEGVPNGAAEASHERPLAMVYEVTPVVRRPEDIIGGQRVPAPEAKAKWLKAEAKERSAVAGAIRRKATYLGLAASRRANADKLLAKSKYLDYASALQKTVADRLASSASN